MTRTLVAFLAVATALASLGCARSVSTSAATADSGSMNMPTRNLTPEEERVIVHKGTERPFTGRYVAHKEAGTYTCKRCGAPLFASDAKFDSRSGWPSFDQALPGAVREVPDRDGQRTEIVCARCDAHLGHVFKGEGFTDHQTRHCVNSVSLDFQQSGPGEAKACDGAEKSADKGHALAWFAGGCFWGVEHHLAQIDGVLDVRSGYMGGGTERPTYRQVTTGRTGHAETVEVRFDPARTSFETIARMFFEIHDPTQVDRQGPDVGNQYRSAVFYADDAQKAVTERLIGLLRASGLRVATQVQKAGTFWPAEDDHQDYYQRTGKAPYCHTRVKRFSDEPAKPASGIGT